MRRHRRPLVDRVFLTRAAVGVLVLVVLGAAAAVVWARAGQRHVESQAESQAEGGGELIATRVVAPLVNQGVYDGQTQALTALDARVRVRMSGTTIQRVKVWSAEGIILYCDDPRLIGQRYPLESDEKALLNGGGGAISAVSDLSKSENVLDQNFGESLEVYVGARDTDGRPILVETYFTADRLHTDEGLPIGRIVTVGLLALLALGLLLPLTSTRAARSPARSQNDRW
jgi:two-component system NarL family sensor kinase